MNRIAKINLLLVFVCVTIVYLIIACAQSPVVTEQSPVVTEQSPVIINEIMFSVPWGPKGDANGDGIRSPRSDEFIELVNAGDTAVDIGGWQILQKKLDVIFTFPVSVVLEPGEFCVVFGGVGSGGFGNQFPSELKIFSSQPPCETYMCFGGGVRRHFSGYSDNVILKNSSGLYIAEVYWGSSSAKTSVGIKPEALYSIDGKSISGKIRQSATREPDITGLWAKHRTVGNQRNFSPGAFNTGVYGQSTSSDKTADIKIENTSMDRSKFYTSYNIWKWSRGDMMCINYKGGRSKMHAGTEVRDFKINKASRNFAAVIKFTTVHNGLTYTIKFNPAWHTGKKIYDYFEYMFTTKNFEELTKGMNKVEIRAIREGVIVNGMSKDAVLACYGPPPEHSTKSLQSNVWTYWRTAKRREQVRFDSDNRTTGKQSIWWEKSDLTAEQIKEKIIALKELYEKGIINQDEYEKKKAELLKKLSD